MKKGRKVLGSFITCSQICHHQAGQNSWKWEQRYQGSFYNSLPDLPPSGRAELMKMGTEVSGFVLQLSPRYATIRQGRTHEKRNRSIRVRITTRSQICHHQAGQNSWKKEQKYWVRFITRSQICHNKAGQNSWKKEQKYQGSFYNSLPDLPPSGRAELMKKGTEVSGVRFITRSQICHHQAGQNSWKKGTEVSGFVL